MKITEGMDIIAKGWIVKPKGFRVRFQQLSDGQLVTGYSPPMEEKLMDSDVTTWRYAYKIAKATCPGEAGIAEGDFVNVTVVDDTDCPIVYYGTGQTQVFNPMP